MIWLPFLKTRDLEAIHRQLFIVPELPPGVLPEIVTPRCAASRTNQLRLRFGKDPAFRSSSDAVSGSASSVASSSVFSSRPGKIADAPTDWKEIRQRLRAVWNQKMRNFYQLHETIRSWKRFQRRFWGIPLLWNRFFPSKRWQKNQKRYLEAIEAAGEAYHQCVLRLGCPFTPGLAAAWHAAFQAFERAKRCQRVWHVESEGESRVERGENEPQTLQDLKLQAIQAGLAPLDCFQYSAPSLFLEFENEIGFHFYPFFCVLIQSGTLTVQPLSDLQAEGRRIRMTTHQKMLSDALRVDRIWKFSRLNGKQDRRHSHNSFQNVMEYFLLELSTKDGLRERCVFSNALVGEAVLTGLRDLIRVSSEFYF